MNIDKPNEAEVVFGECHGLQEYHGEIDSLAHAYIGDGCTGVSIDSISVRIHLVKEVSESAPQVIAAIEAIEQFYQELQGG